MSPDGLPTRSVMASSAAATSSCLSVPVASPTPTALAISSGPVIRPLPLPLPHGDQKALQEALQ